MLWILYEKYIILKNLGDSDSLRLFALIINITIFHYFTKTNLL